MRLDEYVEEVERDEAAEKRRLVKQKSYAIMDHLTEVEQQFEEVTQGDALFGSTAPSIFVGRSGYPDVSAGVLSPVSPDADAAALETGPHWYDEGISIDDVFQNRASLLNSTQQTSVHAAERWDDFVGVQREVAIADHPVDVEIGLDGTLDVDLDVGPRDIATPTGPRATAERADLAENPHVPKPVKKTLKDDEWNAEGAMTYLYRRGLDVYDINTVLSAGAMGKRENRRLVPTRWSITAVDDTVSQYLRGRIRNEPSVSGVEVWHNTFLGNRFWVILAPGQWEFELVEMKAPGSIWNPDDGDYWVASNYEGYEGRTAYADETSGAYYAARLGVLEALAERGRRAKALVLREVTEDYWGPSGVWVIREAVRNAFDGQPGRAESLTDALGTLSGQLPLDARRLQRVSELAASQQVTLKDF